MENYLRFKVRKSKTSHEDYIYRNDNTSSLRLKVDLREWDTMIENQGSLGSCTSSALTSAYELMINQINSQDYVELSDLFIYYNARLEEGELDTDDGIYIKSGLKVLQKYGVCAETLWPYEVSQWNIKPTDVAYEDARKRRIGKYQKLISLYYITEVLNRNKPVVFGMEIYESFMNLDSRIFTVEFPSRKEKSLGGHAMCMIGYDLDQRLFLAKNSFGTDWGMNGYCWIPFDYIKQEGYDFWMFDISPQSGVSNALSSPILL